MREMIISRTEGSRDKKSQSTKARRNRNSNRRSYSNLPLDIFENIFGRLGFVDRVSARGVCKDWWVLSRQVRPSVDKYTYPWAMTSHWWRPEHSNNEIHGYCKLIDPPIRRKYAVKKVISGKEYEVFWSATARASSYGWVLFKNSKIFFLYSPFTREVIKLPQLKNDYKIRVATFNLDATSPKCVIFTLRYSGRNSNKIRIDICCPGDKSWKTFKFISGFESSYYNPPVDGAYANRIFYCVFNNGELGAFDVGLEKWTWLNVNGFPFSFYYNFQQLIVFDGNLQLIGWRRQYSLENRANFKLLKFDFSKKCWVREKNLENRVLFIGYGCTPFSYQAEREISELANHVLSCTEHVHNYGIDSTTSSSDSQRYRNWLNTVSDAQAWIEVPWLIWTAKDLINATL